MIVQKVSRKQSCSSTTSDSSESKQDLEFNSIIRVVPYRLRTELFQTDSFTVSQKLSQKAVSWLITVSWTKDLSQDCFWYSTLLYYALNAQKKIKKQNLTETLFACLSLSIKLTSTKGITLKDLAFSSDKQNIIQKIIEMQSCILEIFDFNIIFPHYLTQIYSCGLSQEQLYNVLYICQLYIMKNCSIFFNYELIERIIKAISSQRERCIFQQDIKNQLMTIFRWKESKIIQNKYSSKFDVQAFMNNLNN